MALFDPDKPAGAIVEHLPNGGAMRNDGVELKPASQNPWYVLATVAGEQGEEFDPGLHARNRRFWNGWMCSWMNEIDRKILAKELNIQITQLEPLNSVEMGILHHRFLDIFQGVDPELSIPNSKSTVKFSKLIFGDRLGFSGFYFHSSGANFDFSVFNDTANFSNVCFAGQVSFKSSTFEWIADFSSARFRRSSKFFSTQFLGEADFRQSQFDGNANFENSFFASESFFSGGSFNESTRFLNAQYDWHVPTFYQREMHQDTTFTEDPAYWPTPTPDNAQHGKQAYTRLRQIAAGQQNPDLEHFFLRQEMRCKEVLAKGIDRMAFAAYRIFADYGISVARPVAGLATTVAIGWALIPAHLKACAGCASTNFIWEGLGISIGNTLPFLGLVGKMHPNFHENAPAWIDALSALQSIVGIILLFFLGLGLRNRFRLK